MTGGVLRPNGRERLLPPTIISTAVNALALIKMIFGQSDLQEN